MSDYNSALPIRTQGDATEKVQVRILDKTTDANQLAIDASGNASTINNNGAGAGAVNIQDGGNSITVDANNLDIRDLVFATDKVDVSGSTVAVTNSDNHDYGIVGANTLRSAAQIGSATGAADFNNGVTGAQTLRVAANLAVAGANVSATNPIPVSILNDNIGTEVNDYNTAVAVASGATSNHDYTVTALKTLLLREILVSGTGKTKAEIRIETGVATGVFVTKFVLFNSTANPNIQLHIDSPISVAAGVRVRIIRTNNDNQAQDLYSTISGQEV